MNNRILSKLNLFLILMHVLQHPFFGEFIGIQNIEAKGINPHRLSDFEVRYSELLIIIFHIGIFASFQELSFPYTRISITHFIDLDRVIRNKERNKEPSVDIFQHFRIKSRKES